MKLLSQKCVGPPGRRNFKKVLTLQCEHCNQVVERTSWSAVTAKSCGCLPKGTHHKSKHPLYAVWHGIKDRCLNQNAKDRARYKDRGITVCSDWLQFEPFYEWAISNGWSESLLIDRIDNSKGYEPSNCRFVSVEASNRNRTNTITIEKARAIKQMIADGKTNTDIAIALNVHPSTPKNIRNGSAWKNA